MVRRSGLTTFVVIGLVAAACGTPAPDVSTPPDPSASTSTAPAESEPPPRSAADLVYQPLSLDEAVAALDDPDTAVQGVLGILDELNIGVYASDGTQILAGSETGPDDLWVMAELLPGLAVSARRPGPTFEDYLVELDKVLASGLTPEELAAAHRVMVNTLPNYPMSRVLRALGVDLSPDERLTRFEAWLLMLVWVPPNGGGSAQGTGPVLAAVAPAALYQIRCPATGNGSQPGYSLANEYGKRAKDTAADTLRDLIADEGIGGPKAQKTAKFLKEAGTVVGMAAKVLDAAKIGQILINIDVSVDTEPIATHEVHTTEGETYEDKLVKITVKVVYLGTTASNELGCAIAKNLGLPDPNTPIEGAKVDFRLDDVLSEHGYTRHREENGPVFTTDASGEWVGWYQPKDEEPESAQKLSDTFLHKERGTYTLTVNVTTAMGQLFNPFSGIEFAMNLLGLNQITGEITVGWHDPAAEIYIERQLGGLYGDMFLTLRTCDGENWTGAMTTRGTLTTAGGSIEVTSDTDLELSVPAETRTGEAPVSINAILEGQIEEATIVNEMTQTGTLQVAIGDDDTATITFDLEQGTQKITITAEGASITRTDVIRPVSDSFTAPVEAITCEE